MGVVSGIKPLIPRISTCKKFEYKQDVLKFFVLISLHDVVNRFYIVIQGSVGVYVRDTFKKSRKRKSIVVRLPRITSDATLHQHPGDTVKHNHCCCLPENQKLDRHHDTETRHQCKCHVTEKSIQQAELEAKYGSKVNILRK